VIDFRSKRIAGVRTKNVALFAIGFLSVSFWLHDSAKCQISLAPPLSAARPAPSANEGLPPAAPNNNASPPVATDDAPPPTATARRSAPPVTGRDAPSSKPAADYDGFTTGVEDEPVPKLPPRPRAANRSKAMKEPDGLAKQPSVDPEDEQLRRKLTICRDCK
jgi:hypothetical protein